MPSETLSNNNTDVSSPSTRELRALHYILIRARSGAYQNSLSGKEIGNILDDTEYLVTLLMSGQEDAAEMFRGTLEHLENRYPIFTGAVARYDQEQEESVASTRTMTVPKTLK